MDLETFALLLIEKNEIIHYKSNKENVRNIYLNLFRERNQKISFWEHLMEMWSFWYIDRFTKTIIHFNKNWIDYLNCKAHEIIVEDQISEKKYITDKSCKLCATEFSSKFKYLSHKEDLSHRIRMQYVTNRSSLRQSNKLRAEIQKNKSTVGVIKGELNQNIDVQLKIENISNTNILLIDVFKVNNNLTEIEVCRNYLNLPCNLEKHKHILVPLKGFFTNSMDIQMPFIIVAKNKAQITQELLVFDVPIEITSEYSNLAKDEGYDSMIMDKPSPPTTPVKYNLRERIVPGVALVRTANNKYKQTVTLLQYEIPQSIVQVLRQVLRVCPDFHRRSYVNEFLQRAIAKDFFYISPRIQEQSYCETLHTLLYLEEAQMKVDIKEYNNMSTLTHLHGTFYLLEVAGLAEARPSLLIGDSVYLKESPGSSTKYQGVVHKVLETAVELGIDSRFGRIHFNNTKFFVEFGFNRRPLKVTHQAVDLIKKHNIASYFFPETSTIEIRNTSSLVYFNKNLNQEQKLAVQNILNVKDVPYLLFGPPGTGKTYTLVEAILQVHKTNNNSKILVCTPSNASANEITSRLAKYLPQSSLFRLLGSIYGHDKQNTFKNTNVNKNGEFFMPSTKELLKYRILLTTVVTAARLLNGGIPDGHFTYVFIDESGYATETETLIPVAGFLSSVRRRSKITGQLVLAGDPKQLGPRIHSNFVKFCGLGISMLERLMTTCNLYARADYKGTYNSKYVTKLIRNYRSHPEILKVSNELFYDGDLIAMGNEYIEVFSKWNNLGKRDFPLLFHDVEGEDKKDKDSPSYYNIQEVEVVMDYLSKILNQMIGGVKIKQEHLGIISPYRKQVLKLKQACNRKSWSNILIGSVEQFQGKEKMIIIISTVRSKSSKNLQNFDQKFHLGFLRNPKRFNVAITRAKALLVVVGNSRVLEQDVNWKKLLDHCMKNKSVIGHIKPSAAYTLNPDDIYRLNINDVDVEDVEFPFDNI
ncbi:unnamed protein product [Brassicogethes aeneus]|uniref:RNA helicase n=1 Tax=Brassicogethes aeneus TaxID=1431903 RepID=A0A9P0FBZ1_BRAAE|nr:unnamed protein product [Brassicogethes aeneus]